MDAIRKAIEKARREFSSGEYYSRMRIQEKLMLLESLLPPEGETRQRVCSNGPCAYWEREHDHCRNGSPDADISTGTCDAWEPAPSSEKALLQKLYDHRGEPDKLNCILMREAKTLLAFSPAPSKCIACTDKATTPDGDIGCVLGCPAPKAPKEKRGFMPTRDQLSPLDVED